jgi:glycerol-3-phosphate acyltransferase PlsY
MPVRRQRCAVATPNRQAPGQGVYFLLMYFLFLLLMLVIGYLSGSVNYAIIVTRLLKGRDIRELDSHNPGAANVFRNVGPAWGLLVGLMDALKSFLPILLGRLLFFAGNTYADFWALFLVGMAAVLGHMKPLFYRFKGGGGLATVLGLFVFFVPVEYLLALLLGGAIVLKFFKGFPYKFGRWIPVMSVVLTPFIVLLFSYILDIPLFAHLSIGGHPWYVVVGAFATSTFMFCMNLPFLIRTVQGRG